MSDLAKSTVVCIRMNCWNNASGICKLERIALDADGKCLNYSYEEEYAI